MKLYSFLPSPNGLKVHLLCEHHQLAIEHAHVNILQGEQRQPEFLTLNPNGKIPVLVDGELVLSESNAILIYLAQKNSSSLYSQTQIQQAHILQWLFWQTAHWGPACGKILFENLLKAKYFKMGEPDQSVLEEGFMLFDQFSTVLDGQLKKQSFIANDELSIADFAIGAWLPRVTFKTGLP